MNGFKVKILGSDFQVLYDTPDLEAVGLSNDCSRTIKIDPKLLPEVQNEIYWHEIVHMMLSLTGLTHMLNEGQDEAIAQALGFAFHRFFIDNSGKIKTLYRKE